MTDDATLSDFGPDGSTDDGGDDGSSDSDESETGSREPNGGSDSKRSSGNGGVSDGESNTAGTGDEGTDDDEPIRSTYAWGSYTCSRCEADTERVWRDGREFVCPDCKPW